jgi:peptidyl-prolyl cis-trans isomerase D
MLQAMRTGKGSKLIKYTVFGLLILGMLGLVFMDPNNMVRFKGTGNQSIVTSDVENISAVTFDSQFKNTLRQTGLSLNDALNAGFANDVLNQLINRSIYNKAAVDAQIIPDDLSAANEIRTVLAPLTAQGLSEKDALARLLDSQNMTEEMLVSAIKSDLKIRFLIESLTKTAHVPPQMLDMVYRLSKEKRKAAYVTLTPDVLPAIAAPTDEELEKYYNETLKEKMRIPEFRSFDYSILPLKHFKEKPITLSDDELKAIYDERQNEYQIPKQILVEQVVVSTKDAADNILKAVQTDKKNFADAIKTHGGADAVFIPLAPFDEGGAEAKVAEAVKNLKAKSLSPVIETPLGFYVVNVVDIKPAVAKSFDEVKDELRQKAQSDMASDKLYETATKIEQRLAQGEALSAITKAYDLSAPMQTAAFTAMGMTRDNTLAKDVFGQGEDGLKIAQTLFDVPKSKGRMIELKDGDFLLVTVKDIIPSETKAFAEVKDTVKRIYLAEKQREAFGTKAVEIESAIRDGEKTLEDIAREYKLTVKTTPLLSRALDASKDYNASFISSLFNLDDTKDVASTISSDTLSVTILTLKEQVKVEKNAINRQSDDYKTFVSNLGAITESKTLEAFKAHLLAKYNVKIDEAAFRDYLKSLESPE